MPRINFVRAIAWPIGYYWEPAQCVFSSGGPSKEGFDGEKRAIKISDG
jgi:hypothetical protein